jgi:cysteine sulfinate desulfinase/cysteine desulfurase-like protein
MADSEEPSHVIQAMKPDSLRHNIRFSLGVSNTGEEIADGVAAVNQAIKALV